MALAIETMKKPPVSATDQVFDVLYDAVISIKLPPGTKVSEADIAKQLGVSRQPVRDAFFRLSNLGFLSIRPQRATLITQISLQAVHNAVFTRIALEVECLRTAMTNANEALIVALEDNLQRQLDAVKTDKEDFHALDERFHEIICDAAGHGHAWTLIKEQKAHLDRIRFLTLSQERRHLVVAEHQRILDAVKAHDIPLAESSLRAHIGDVTSVLEDILQKFPDYFEETSGQ